MPSKFCDEITYAFQNFNGDTEEIWEWISIFPHASRQISLLFHAGDKVNPCQLNGSLASANHKYLNWNTWMAQMHRAGLMHRHDDVIKWKHFPRYWPFVRVIHWSHVSSPHKGQWRGALMFSLICAWINGWVNNREAGDLRRHSAHYDVIVMWI